MTLKTQTRNALKYHGLFTDGEIRAAFFNGKLDPMRTRKYGWNMHEEVAKALNVTVYIRPSRSA
jgi:hypothetical protein